MGETIRKEVLYLVFTVLVTGAVAVFSILASINSLEEISWAVLAVAAIRAIAAALVVVLGKYVVKPPAV